MKSVAEKWEAHQANAHKLPKVLFETIYGDITSHITTINEILEIRPNIALHCYTTLISTKDIDIIKLKLVDPFLLAKSVDSKMEALADAIYRLHVLYAAGAHLIKDYTFDKITDLGETIKDGSDTPKRKYLEGSTEYNTLAKRYLEEISSIAKSEIEANIKALKDKGAKIPAALQASSAPASPSRG